MTKRQNRHPPSLLSAPQRPGPRPGGSGDERALDSARDAGEAAGRRGDAKRCAFPRLPGAHLRGWLLQKKPVLKNYDTPARSPTQRRKSQLHALSFPPLGTF